MIRGSWWKARIALQLLAEEHVGARLRAEVEGELASEEAAFAEAQKVMGRAR